MAQWRAANKERLAAYNKQWSKTNAEHRLAYKADYRDANREAINAYAAAYYAANKAERLAYAASYRATKPEKSRAAQRKWRQENPEQQKALQKAWRDANPEADIAHRQVRRSRMVGGKLSKGIVKSLLEAQGWRCVYCAADLNLGKHLDHKTPLVRGGQNVDENVQLTCPTCNLKKHSKTHEEFVRSL